MAAVYLIGSKKPFRIAEGEGGVSTGSEVQMYRSHCYEQLWAFANGNDVP